MPQRVHIKSPFGTSAKVNLKKISEARNLEQENERTRNLEQETWNKKYGVRNMEREIWNEYGSGVEFFTTTVESLAKERDARSKNRNESWNGDGSGVVYFTTAVETDIGAQQGAMERTRLMREQENK